MAVLDRYQTDKSCVITIVPNVATRTVKKFALIPMTTIGYAATVTVNSIQIGSYTASCQGITAQHPGGSVGTYNPTAVARGFYLPVIPGQNITIDFSLNGGSYVGVMLAVEDGAAPTVDITSPTAGTPFDAPTDVTIAATAADSEGTVSTVEFYDGSTKLGEDTTSPYSYTWTNAPVGSHTLTAKAIDNQGVVTTSTPVQITVNAPQARDLDYIILPSAPVQMQPAGTWSNNLYEAMAPWGYTLCLGTSYTGGNSIGIDRDPATPSSRWDLTAGHEFPTTATVGLSTTKPTWWAFGAGQSTVDAPSYGGYCTGGWNVRHYAIGLLDRYQTDKSCTITIVPTVAERTTKRIAVIPMTSLGYAATVTVNSIQIGNYTASCQGITAQHPGGNGGTYNPTAIARGFLVPVIPGQNITLNLTLSGGSYVGMFLAMED
jgi:hypothetical protein